MKNKNKQTKFPVVCFLFLRGSSWECYTDHPFISISKKIQKARIKKIMQKDEEVGKVAQATPIVICASIGLGASPPTNSSLPPGNVNEVTLQQKHWSFSWL
jgi:hypothetical protein